MQISRISTLLCLSLGYPLQNLTSSQVMIIDTSEPSSPESTQPCMSLPVNCSQESQSFGLESRQATFLSSRFQSPTIFQGEGDMNKRVSQEVKGPCCYCGIATSLRTVSRNTSNRGHVFWTCVSPHACKLFAWKDVVDFDSNFLDGPFCYCFPPKRSLKQTVTKAIANH